VCAPIWNGSHIVCTLLHCGLQRNDQYRTHNQHLFPLLPANRQRKEELRSVSESDGMTDGVASRQTTSLPSVWRTKKGIRRKSIDFGFSGLFDFLFLRCPYKFSVRWTRYFLCCSTTSIWLLVQAWHRADIYCSESLRRSERWKLTEVNSGWSLVFINVGWFTGATSVSSDARGKSCVLKMFLSQWKRPVARQPLAVISPFAARLYAVPNCSQFWRRLRLDRPRFERSYISISWE